MENPVQISTCPKCKGIVTAAIFPASLPDKVNNKRKIELLKEANKYNLTIATLPKSEVQSMPWCPAECDGKPQ